MSRFSAAELGLPEAVPCPFCAGGQTELHSAFGSQLSVATYWCRRCGTAFEWFKRDAPQAPDGASPAAAVTRAGDTPDRARGDRRPGPC